MLSSHYADVYTDFNGIAKLKQEATKNSPEALKEAAKQFEALFLGNILKNMRSAKLADGLMDSSQTQFFHEMYDQQLAVHIAGKSDLGLAELIVKQLKPEQESMTKQTLQDYLAQPVTALKPSGVKLRALSTSAPLSDEMTAIGFAEANDSVPTHSFIRELQPYAEQAARELGVAPKALLAQAALETGWGKSCLRQRDGSNTYNLFNIKADKSWTGKQTKVAALEFDQGVAKKVNSGFRSYASYQESFQDYVKFIKSNPRYHDALQHAGNPARYMHELQQAGYATDPRYAEKVMQIFHSDLFAVADNSSTVD
ncbi:flagellar assembly peptidoglycan hydrolase FlgJ [Methylocucumis oryzae]|uniref:Peptidoglycan hydrolase FlgJ n=1 Tax=Methylocucumis oryzae TaxID=1632867 RepID=A0A0F3IK19_9GAMM|nr:flagellar assembly peptidoglycan hydrolase FlgJ [Methylocucumis oryzae]KJV07090.1 flagellar rod assembly protein FlgJ [Methylocucumis oryzae]